MTEPQQLQSATLPCPKTGCRGRIKPVNTWASKKQKHLCVQLQCPQCKLRDFQTFPIPAEVPGTPEVPAVVTALEFGSIVQHPVHGKGMVVQSGPNFSRVCFQGKKGKEQECLTADLSLDGSAEELNAYRCTLNALKKQKGSGVLLPDPSTPPGDQDDRPSIFTRGCDLCRTTGVTLRFTEGLWACKACLEVMEVGERVVRGSE